MRIKNGLIVVVILLFINVTVQPSVAVNHISSDNEDDCDICPKVSKLKELGKYQELFDRITTFIGINKELKSDIPLDDYPYPIICSILENIFNRCLDRQMWWKDLFENHPIISLSLFGIFCLINLHFASFILGLLNILCWIYPI